MDYHLETRKLTVFHAIESKGLSGAAPKAPKTPEKKKSGKYFFSGARDLE